MGIMDGYYVQDSKTGGGVRTHVQLPTPPPEHPPFTGHPAHFPTSLCVQYLPDKSFFQSLITGLGRRLDFQNFSRQMCD